MKMLFILLILLTPACGGYDPLLWIKPFNYSIGMGYKQKTQIPVYVSIPVNSSQNICVETEGKEIVLVSQKNFIIEEGKDLVMVPIEAVGFGSEILNFVIDADVSSKVTLQVDVTGEETK